MAKFSVGQTVFVPSTLIGGGGIAAHALVAREVLTIDQRSIIVNTFDHETTSVSVRNVHSNNLGFLLLRVGDFKSEAALLDPLAKSILHFLRLLLPEDAIRVLNVRTVSELQVWWEVNSDTFSHVVMIGHGAPDSIKFLTPEHPITGRQLANILDTANPTCTPKVFISLACLTGRTAFAKEFSASRVCKDLVAPFQSVHGAGASQYLQTLLTHHLLGALGLAAAHKRASASGLPGGRFRWFKDGDFRDPL